MSLLLRTTISLLITLWLGAILFFPVVAAIAFRVLPDRHTAGFVVRGCLLFLHQEGLIAGALLLLFLGAAAVARAYGEPKAMAGPLLCTAAMLLLTGASQWGVMPRMERDRLLAGGDTDTVPRTNPYRLDFDRLHTVSVRLEGGVLAAGVGLVVLLARTPRGAPSRPTERR